ncbi:hypothetical protein [Nocardioides albertanoniae]|nr:hypothetical protein [Nocardioides albertanoniae]
MDPRPQCERLGTRRQGFEEMRLDVDASEIPWETGVLVHRPTSLPVTW